MTYSNIFNVLPSCIGYQFNGIERRPWGLKSHLHHVDGVRPKQQKKWIGPQGISKRASQRKWRVGIGSRPSTGKVPRLAVDLLSKWRRVVLDGTWRHRTSPAFMSTSDETDVCLCRQIGSIRVARGAGDARCPRCDAYAAKSSPGYLCSKGDELRCQSMQ